MFYDVYIACGITIVGMIANTIVVIAVSKPLATLFESAEAKSAECVEIKKSNHIFPDLVPPK